MNQRSCGDCSACCHTFAVEEINKDRHSACANRMPEGGCNIYAMRPDSCRQFMCAWLSGELEAPERPDQSGFIGYVPAPYLWRKGFKIMVVIESAEGEASETQRQTQIKELHKLGFPAVRLHSSVTKPEIQWHLNAAAPGMDALWEDLADAGYAVQVTTVT